LTGQVFGIVTKVHATSRISDPTVQFWYGRRTCWTRSPVHSTLSSGGVGRTG